MKHLHLHIDRLVLRGFRPDERHGVAAGLQAELARILSDPGAARQLTAHSDVSRLSIGNVTIHSGATPHQVGMQLARGIDARMKK